MSETTVQGGNIGDYNAAIAVIASGTYIAADPTPVVVENRIAQGVQVILDVSAKHGSPTTLQVVISGVDPVSTKKYVLLTGATVNSTGTTSYTVFPKATAATNVANNFVPRQFEVKVVSAGVDADNYFTYSVSANLLR